MRRGATKLLLQKWVACRFVELAVSRNIWGKGGKALGRGGSHATGRAVRKEGAQNYVLDSWLLSLNLSNVARPTKVPCPSIPISRKFRAKKLLHPSDYSCRHLEREN